MNIEKLDSELPAEHIVKPNLDILQQLPTKKELEELGWGPIPPLDYIGLGVLGMLIKKWYENINHRIA